MYRTPINFANNLNKNSFASRLRRKRYNLFLQIIKPNIFSDVILDIGGTAHFWENNGYKGRVDLLNIKTINHDNCPKNFNFIKGDALFLKQCIKKNIR